MHLGATDSLVCPVKAVPSYLEKRSTRAGPLFITSEGKGWTRRMFCASLKSMLLDQHSYNTRSLRIGAATSAFLAQFLDTHIQIFGRWRSNAFKSYIRPGPRELAKLSKAMATGI